MKELYDKNGLIIRGKSERFLNTSKELTLKKHEVY